MIALFVRDTTDMDATPIFATADPEVLRQLVTILLRRVGSADRLPPKLMELRKVQRPQGPKER